MLIEKEKVLRTLEDYLEANPIDYWNDFTYYESKSKYKTIKEIINMIKSLN